LNPSDNTYVYFVTQGNYMKTKRRQTERQNVQTVLTKSKAKFLITTNIIIKTIYHILK